MTLADLRTQVRIRLGGSSRQDLISGDGLTALDYWINFAVRELAHTFRFPQLERLDSSRTTSTADAFVSIPSDAYAIRTVFDITNAVYLRPLPGGFEEYERTRVLSSDQGRPTHWVRQASSIYFKPRPNGAYGLRMLVQDEPATLAAPGDIPIIPEVWHDAIMLLAVRNGWNALDETSRATAVEQGEYRAFLTRVRLPQAIESHTRRPRGIRAWRGIRDRRLGI